MSFRRAHIITFRCEEKWNIEFPEHIPLFPQKESILSPFPPTQKHLQPKVRHMKSVILSRIPFELTGKMMVLFHFKEAIWEELPLNEKRSRNCQRNRVPTPISRIKFLESLIARLPSKGAFFVEGGAWGKQNKQPVFIG